MEQVFLIYRSDRNCDLRAKCGCAQNNEPFLRLRAVPAASGRNPLASTVELGTIPASSTDMDEQRGRWGSMRRDLGGGDRKRQRLWLRWRPATMGFPTGAPSVPGGGPPGALLTEVEASPVIVARCPFERAAHPPARQGRGRSWAKAAGQNELVRLYRDDHRASFPAPHGLWLPTTASRVGMARPAGANRCVVRAGRMGPVARHRQRGHREQMHERWKASEAATTNSASHVRQAV